MSMYVVEIKENQKTTALDYDNYNEALNEFKSFVRQNDKSGWPTITQICLVKDGCVVRIAERRKLTVISDRLREKEVKSEKH